MKSLRIFIILFSLIIFTSCIGDRISKESIKINKPAFNPDGSFKVDSSAVNMRLIVSFISIGQGIDSPTKEKYDTWLSNQSKKVKYDEAHWGREGEVDYCFTLSELSKKEQDDFVVKTKEMLSVSKLIFIKENAPCDKKK